MIKGRLKLFSDDLLIEWLSTLPFTPHRTNRAPPCRLRQCLFQRFRVLRDAHADALAGVWVILRFDADEEMFAWDNQRAFGFEHFVQSLRRNRQVFKPKATRKSHLQACGFSIGYAPNSRLSRETAVCAC